LVANDDRVLIAEFRELHEKARKRAFTGDDRSRYETVRDQISAVLCAGQSSALLAGQTPRQSFRLATVWPLLVDHAGKSEKTSTMDLSSGGFSAILERVIPTSSRVQFAMKLPRPYPLVRGPARVVGGRMVLDTFRASFAFEPLEPNAREQLDFAIADAVLAHFGERR
jgi:hypothetical protein